MTRKDLPEQQAFPTRSASIPPRATASRSDLEARRAAAQQARIATAAAVASPQRAGFHAGLHPVDAPYTSGDVRPPSRSPAPIRLEDEGDHEDDLLLGDEAPRSHTGARRYAPLPPSSLRTAALPERTRVLPRPRSFQAHWLLIVGVLLCIMILGWAALSALGGWWTTQQNDWGYGRPRTFQVDAVVGHNGDSPAHPSHFLAMNLHRQVLVLEIPAGDPSRMQVYLGPVLVGDGQDLMPVTLSFEDRNGDGKPDLNIHIGDQTIVFLNEHGTFVPIK